ncbi:lactate racemase domain-containing protein [Desulfogranum mediterraneum]|uniref:lactate racemase domain-containing protein n=1 Tax=Desulfogranum mediterraneum TaxID=160661 RepID=UPI0003FD3F06|nr:lactate racemase domain-containing protein [Desulfogranum mediterraneum]
MKDAEAASPDARRIDLAYGQGQLPFSLPPGARELSIREPLIRVSKQRFLRGLDTLLPPAPLSGPIAVVLADKTRRCGYEYGIPWLLEGLAARGADPGQVSFYIAYGTHQRQSEAECVQTYGRCYHLHRFVHHDCSDPASLASLGTTRRGTELTLHHELLTAGLIISFGAVSHHYFAGYGGGRKLLFPGLGGRRAIYQNHSLFLDAERRQLARGCNPGRLSDNPLAADLAEIHALLPSYRSIHALLNSRGEVADHFFGSGYGDFLRVCDLVDHHFKAADPQQYDLVLASAGGTPKDINLIQSHKAIHNSAAFVKDGGSLVMVAQCADQLGSTTFLPYFTMGGWKGAFDHLCHDYAGNGGTALALMAKTRRIKIYLVSDLDQAHCAACGLSPLSPEQSQTLIDGSEPNHSMAVIPCASLLVHPHGHTAESVDTDCSRQARTVPQRVS